MIFSFHVASDRELNFTLKNADIFCFFSLKNNIFIPESEWSLAVSASLRMKKNILILESFTNEALAINDRQRIIGGPDFLWMAPHALSVFNKAVHENSGSYTLIKSCLLNSNYK
jgi:hypothetical protein